ncbi:lytic transglycosylase domain-containing protein [Tropicimonas sp. IMCC34011]|uniref:lytic transglycosylase domain-containing protein n=1 Tax=Tropicimonas sp. IMCC34011 TaxID=2248759 RepID=UPI000E2882E3|nr:lytic transglycosylase domain-containing protein [Tropicimonas sp. IMCC34011]
MSPLHTAWPIVLILCAGSVAAQDDAGTAPQPLVSEAAALPSPPPPKDFTFKRVRVGTPVAGRRITIQIDPEEQRALLAARPALPEKSAVGDAPAPGAVPSPAKPAAHAWFWTQLSPGFDGIGPGRLDAALAALDSTQGSSVRRPRLQHLQTIAERHGTDILRATIGTQVSPAFALAVIGVESAGRTDAVSHAGATGLMQLMPDTATRFGVTDSRDAAQNIRGGVAYLDWLLSEFGRDPLLALAGYNAGEGAVREHDGVPPYAETRDYVPKVLAAWSVAKGLCVTPPLYISDGCVFRVSAAGG